ncbi:hypothetical protein WKI68_36925 [Streptomyces sp. MS1.HAVA.3]|uniref:Uncharacterized protein n=1 Tax=Streptomyces caledonius TaxID=3134107 RepID=A0ABU8UBL9_9ACTN
MINQHVTINGAIDPVSTAQQVRRMFLELKRNYGGADLGIA